MDKKDFESLLKKYPDCVSDGKKLKAFLKDLFPDVPKAIVNTLTIMADDGIISEMKMSPESSSLVSARLQKKLEDDYGLSQNIISKCFSLIPNNAKQTKSTISAYTHEKITGFIDTQPKSALRKEGSQKLDILQPKYNPKDFKIVKGVLKEYKGRSSVVVIPDSVTRIGSAAFDNCTGLTSVTIGNGVTSIGDWAFDGCKRLTSITIHDSVTSIGHSAFYNCTGLTSVTIPDSVTSIGNDAFYNCRGLTSVTIPNGVTSIGDYAFYGCSSLTSITIPDSVTSIGYEAFYNTAWYNNQPDGLVYAGKVAYKYKGTMPSNTSIVLEEGTLGIASSAFRACTGLTSITIPDSVTYIDEYAFYDCRGLTSVTIPDSVTSIDRYTFDNCTSLTSVTIGNSVTSIGDDAFRFCTGLTSVTIPDSVTSIGEGAFYWCTGLTSITIPDSVTSIGEGAFSVCNKIQDVYIADIGAWCNIAGLDNLMEYGASNKKLYINNELATSITIPNGVTAIPSFAFRFCTGLTSVTIPDSVTSIGYSAFRGCTGLTSVTIPDSVTSIGNYAFEGCRGLTSVTIPDSVTSIGWGAFFGCRNLTIYCEAESKPIGWSSDWNSGDRPVVWGFKN